MYTDAHNPVRIATSAPAHLNASVFKCTRRSGRTIAAVLGFLTLFAILVILSSKFYLIPGLEAAKHATREHRRKIAAEALLLMSILLMILLLGLLMTFRISRFFFPRPGDPRSRTKVVDAWAEAGKRLEEKSDDGEDIGQDAGQD